MTLNDLIQKLERMHQEHGAHFVRDFESVLADVAALNDRACIVKLAAFFNDDAVFDELMFSIIHTIENFEDRVYVEELLVVAPDLCSRTPKWASILFMRVLNSDSTRLELIRQLRNAPTETKAATRLLMDKINARSAEFLSKTTAVIVAAA